MKKILILISLIIIKVGYTQEIIKCNNNLNFLYLAQNDFHSYMKIQGQIKETENKQVFTLNNFPIQTLLIYKNTIHTKGDKNLETLVTYILNEVEYLTGVYKEKLKLKLDPIELADGKKAVLWSFDVPESFKKNIQSTVKVDKQVFISRITGEFIYSIASSQFSNQKFEKIKDILIKLIRNIEYGKVKEIANELCK